MEKYIFFILSIYSSSSFSILDKSDVSEVQMVNENIQIRDNEQDSEIKKTKKLSCNLHNTFGRSSSNCEKKLLTRLGDKYFVYQKLVKIFGNDIFQRNIYYNFLLPYSSFFGGTCEIASSIPIMNDNNGLSTCESSTFGNQDCQGFVVGHIDMKNDYFNMNRCFSISETERKLITNSNTARVGLNAQICFHSVFGVTDPEAAMSRGSGFTNLMNLVCGSDSCDWSTDNTKKLYQLFYPYAVDFSTSENEELMESVYGDEENRLSDDELFQVLSYSLCSDISWQSF